MRNKGLLSVKIPGLRKTVQEKPVSCEKLCIDYPQQGETVCRGHYAVRISGGNGESQVAIDSGTWQECRADGGYHWYDWFPETPGRHSISVRSRVNNKWIKTERTCDVE